MSFLTADDLAQVGFGEKAHRRTGAVVKIGRFGDELPARILDKADVHPGAKDRITQPLRRNPLQGLVKGQRVHEHGASDIGRVRRQVAVLPGIDLLRQRLLPGRPGRDIVGDGRQVRGLPETGHDLLADRLMPGIDMVKVYRGRVRRPFRL